MKAPASIGVCRRFSNRVVCTSRIPTALAACLAIASLSATAQTQLLSARNPAALQPAGGNGDSVSPIVSGDGRYILFVSSANNLASGGNSQLCTEIYVRDRASNTTTLVSVNTSGTGGGNGNSMAYAISQDGRYVLFDSAASDLVPGDTNGTTDVFVRDLVAGTTTLVSVATDGGFGNGVSSNAVMTPDGRYVAFVSYASNLVPNDTNGMPDVFVRDLVAGATTLVSVGAIAAYPQTAATVTMDTPVITPDGRYVAFFSTAELGLSGTNVYPGGYYFGGDIYLHDLLAATTIWVSTNSVNYAPSIHPCMSDDGRFVAFKSGENPTNVYRFDAATGSNTVMSAHAFLPASGLQFYGVDDIFGPEMTPDGRFIAYVVATVVTNSTFSSVHLWDGQSATDTLVSQDQFGGFPSNTFSDTPVVSPDGRYVAFLSTATNLVTNSISSGYHIYLRDMQGGVTQLVDADTNGIGSTDDTGTVPMMSTNGQFVAFCSPDGSLVASDNNHFYDVFVRDTLNGTNQLISSHGPSLGTQAGTGFSSLSQVSVSANGQRVLFASRSDDLVTNDFNGDQDIFVADLAGGTNILVSVGLDGNAALGGMSSSPVMSADGRYVAFASSATNLVANDTNSASDIFLRDLQAGTTILVDVNSSGVVLGNGDSSAPVISQDGRYVAFLSQTSTGPASTYSTPFWRDTIGNVTVVLVTNLPALPIPSTVPSMSADGRYVAYTDSLSHLLVWDSQTQLNIYTNVTAGISSHALSPTGSKLLLQAAGQVVVVDLVGQSNLFSFASAVQIKSAAQWSAGERYFTFVTASNAAPGDLNATNDVYLCDLQTGTITLVSANYSGTGSGNGASDSPAMSADARFVAFRSFATDIVAGNANTNVPNIFVFDRVTGSNALLTVEAPQSSWSTWTAKPAINTNGSLVAFQSFRPALVPADLDLNRVQDVFAAPQSLLATTDSDGDGIPDWWMMKYFGHPTGLASDNSLAQDDADGNGMSNLQKYLVGLDPTNPASVFRIVITPLVSSNNLVLSWPTMPGKSFKVQYKLSLTDPSWLDQGGTVWISGNQAYSTLPLATPSQYYRAVSED